MKINFLFMPIKFLITTLLFSILCLVNIPFAKENEEKVLGLENNVEYKNQLNIDEAKKGRSDDYYEIARFSVEPGLLRSYLTFTLYNDTTISHTFVLNIIGYSEGEKVEEQNILLTSNRDTVILLQQHTQSLDKNINIDYKVFLKLRYGDETNPSKIHYSIKLSNLLFSQSQLVYLIVSIIFFILILFLLKEGIQRKILNYNWGDSYWAKGVDYLARVLIVILILDEIGLFLNEWDINNFIFSGFRFIIGLPGVSHLVFVSNFVIILPATYRIVINFFSKYEDNTQELLSTFGSITNLKEYKPKYAFLISLMIFSISILIWNGQCLIWDEYDIVGIKNFSLSFWLVVPVILLPIILMIIIARKITALGRYKSNSFYLTANAQGFYIVSTIFFLSFSQTMITKIIVLLPLINKLREFGIKIIRGVPPKDKISEYLLIPSSIDENLKFINYLILTTSSFLLIIYWQLAITPFPPLNSVYPKTFTISLLYTLYILFYFFVVSGNKLFIAKSFLWIILTLIILHFLPLIMPQWFIYKSELPEKYSIIAMFSFIMNLTQSSILFFTLHIFIFITFYLLIYAYIIKEKLFRSDFYEYQFFKRYFLLSIYSQSFLMLSFFVIVFILVAISKASIIIVLEILPKEVLFLLSILPLTFLFLLLIQGAPKTIFEEIMKVGGVDLVNRIKTNNRFLSLYKVWNDNKISKRGILFFLTSLVVVWLIFYTILSYLPSLAENTNFKLLWFKELNSDKDYFFDIKETKHNLIFSGFLNVHCFDKKSGELFWSKDKYAPITSIVNDSLIWIADKKNIELINIFNGETLHSRSIINRDQNVNVEDVRPSGLFNFYGNYVSAKEGVNLIVIDAFSGLEKFRIKDIKSPLPYQKGGPLVWKNSSDEIWFSDINSRPFKSFELKDSIIHIISYPQDILVFTADSIFSLNGTAKRKWSIASPLNSELSHTIDCSIYDSSIVLAVNGDLVFFLSRKDGTIFNQVSGFAYHYSYRPTIPFNDLLLKNEFGVLLLDNDKNQFSFFDELGSRKFVFAYKNKYGYFNENFVVSLSKESIYIADGAFLRKYSISDNKMMYEDTYQLVIKDTHSKFIKYNLSLLKPISMLVSGNRIYWTNFRGIFAAEYFGEEL